MMLAGRVMPENQAEASSLREETTEVASLRCGDCHAAVAVRSAASLSTTAAQEAGDFYCPACAKELPSALLCDACGSAICSTCGAPVELADELGIG
jgi:hypothetical protein